MHLSRQGRRTQAGATTVGWVSFGALRDLGTNVCTRRIRDTAVPEIRVDPLFEVLQESLATTDWRIQPQVWVQRYQRPTHTCNNSRGIYPSWELGIPTDTAQQQSNDKLRAYQGAYTRLEEEERVLRYMAVRHCVNAVIYV
jgi:hypothetical protein